MDIQPILPGLSTLLIGLLVILFIFLIFREIVTWYWKINKIVSSLESTERVLRNIDKNLVKAINSMPRQTNKNYTDSAHPKNEHSDKDPEVKDLLTNT